MNETFSFMPDDVFFTDIELSELCEFIVSDFTYDIIKMNCKTQIDKLDINKCADNIKESGLISFKLLIDTTTDNCMDSYVINRKKYLNHTDIHIIKSLNTFLSFYSKETTEIELIEKLANILLKFNPAFTQILSKITDALLSFNNISHTKTAPDLASYLNIIANEVNINNRKSNVNYYLAYNSAKEQVIRLHLNP